jgi:hypothetical protein
MEFPPPQVHLLDHVLRPRDLLIGSAQPQFLLVFHALAKMQHGLQWEMESHDLEVPAF